MIACSLCCVLRDWSVSSLRSTNPPGCFRLVYTARVRKGHVLDFCQGGPRAGRPDWYWQEGQARQAFANAGPLSVAVPAGVKGYAERARRFEKKPLAQLVSPAEQIAL